MKKQAGEWMKLASRHGGATLQITRIRQAPDGRIVADARDVKTGCPVFMPTYQLEAARGVQPIHTVPTWRPPVVWL